MNPTHFDDVVVPGSRQNSHLHVPHKMSRVVIKKARVDVQMASIVQMMNRHHDVYTVYSCQGRWRVNPRNKHRSYSKPYVLFHCWRTDVLDSLRKWVESTNGRLYKTRRMKQDSRQSVNCFKIEWSNTYDRRRAEGRARTILKRMGTL